MKKIKLPNRYNANIWLEHIDADLWQLKSTDPSELNYMRVGYEDDNKTIAFIDPSGGPFINIGYEINDCNIKYRVKEIFKNNFIIRLEKI